MSSPRLAPRLMPLTTRSGFSLRKPSTARRTQSVELPSVMNAACPVRSCVGRQRSGRKSVMLWLAPLQLRSGAMTSTSPSSVSASTSGPSASLSIPSSFVTRMCLRGLPFNLRPTVADSSRLIELACRGKAAPRSPSFRGLDRGVLHERGRLGALPAARVHLDRVADERVDDAGDRHAEQHAPEAGDLGAEEQREEHGQWMDAD